MWHFTICSVVWMLELSKVGCEDLASSENKLKKKKKKKKNFWDPFQNRKPDPKVCGEWTWLPIYKMVWHLTIGSAVWMLELSKVGCEDFASFSERMRRRRGGHFGSSPLIIWSFIATPIASTLDVTWPVWVIFLNNFFDFFDFF